MLPLAPHSLIAPGLAVLMLASTGCARSGPPAPLYAYGSPAPPPAADARISVAPGDTLYGIARRHGLPVRALIAANHLEPPYLLQTGMVLTLPQRQMPGPTPDQTGAQAQVYVVSPGETLDGVARRHHVKETTLADLNHLQAPYLLRTGQRLTVPAPAETPRTAAAAPPPPPETKPPAVQTAALPPLPAAPESPPAVALAAPPIPLPESPPVAAAPPLPERRPESRTAGTRVAETRTAGMPIPLTPPNPPLRPAVGAAPAMVALNGAPKAPPPWPERRPQDARPASGIVPLDVAVPPESPRPHAAAAPPLPHSRPSRAPERVAAVPPEPRPAPPPRPVAAPPLQLSSGGLHARFSWPVEGRVISPFGEGPSGTQNDGINIAAPAGTPVLAAAGGVVAYVGNQLHGYGNLVLIKHDGGYMTAYAHNAGVMVRRGERVRRGQEIARVGETGTVSEPQLHFEVRHGSHALDPTGYLPSLRADRD